jgi:glycine cleavage system H protein
MSPVAGEVVAVNEALNEKPSIINASPEGEGWIVKLKVESLEAEGLMEEAEYKKFTEE